MEEEEKEESLKCKIKEEGNLQHKRRRKKKRSKANVDNKKSRTNVTGINRVTEVTRG